VYDRAAQVFARQADVARLITVDVGLNIVGLLALRTLRRVAFLLHSLVVPGMKEERRNARDLDLRDVGLGELDVELPIVADRRERLQLLNLCDQIKPLLVMIVSAYPMTRFYIWDRFAPPILAGATGDHIASRSVASASTSSYCKVYPTVKLVSNA